jgi:phosphate transport system permease protein
MTSHMPGEGVKRPPLFRLFKHCYGLAAPLLLFCLLSLLGFLLYHGAPSLNLSLLFGDVPPLEAISGRRPVWDGLWPAFTGTLCLIGLTMGLALLPGIGCGLYLAEYASPRRKKIIDSAVDILAGTPSIVMGLFGFTLILFLRRTLLPEANTGLLPASACLALLVLPVLIVGTREALEAVPESLRLTAAALGFSRSQRLRRVLLPAAGQGLWGGLILAIGRCAEDTAVIMLTGAVANAGLPAGLTAKFEALPFFVYYITAQYQTQEELLLGFGAALLLLLLAGGLTLLAHGLETGYRRRWQGGKR